LSVISSFPGELEPVFQATLENATRLCEAKFGVIFYYRDGTFYPAAELNTPTAYSEFIRQRGSFLPAAGSTFEQLIRTKQVINLTDAAAQGPFFSNAAAKLGGARSQISVPMLKEDELIGAIAIYRQQVRPFTDKQIELVKNFAAQAVIAIEDTRLLNELRESLNRQTATADILRVIASTPEDSKHALDTIAETASHMFGVANVNFRRIDGDVLRIVSSAGPTIEKLRKALPDIPLEPTDPAVRCFLDNRQIPVEDRRAVLTNERGAIAAALRELPVRSQVFTPLSRQGKAIGVMIVTRGEVQPFQQRDLDLMKGFADQAVIAIENARLLSELRQRTTDLTESLEQQTATADVLRVISSSPGNLEPVFQAMLEKAVSICNAKFGTLFRFDGSAFHLAARVNTPAALAEFQKKRGPFLPPPGSNLDRMMRTKQVQHSADDAAEPVPAQGLRLGGARSIVHVPMLQSEQLVGALVIYRQEVRPFTEKQIELLRNFAAQAVIAIENTRLLNDLNKLNQQLEQRVADQVGEIERMGRLRRFLPPQVADLIVASGTEKQLESHRREITALFCDLRGFTGFSESSDPEDVMALLRDYHAAIGEIIVKYSGTLERFAGDGVMVIFNDPVPVENPALQAVLMALDMRTAIGAMIEKWRLLGHDLGFGTGIAHGFATLGTIGFEGRYDYAAIGTVSNVASRLCDEAKPGQILISPRVMLAVEKTVTVELVGEFNLKGIRRPMAAYNVLAPSISKPN
jgi:GAF domain-containing protein